MNKKNQGVAVTALICLLLIAGILWVYYSAVFGETKQEKKKEISVVLYYNGSNGWESLMEGLKQAEDDFSVSINYVMAKEGMSGEEQMALVQKEIEDGAQGILLAASDSMTDYQAIQAEAFPVPIITIESCFDSSSYTHISADDYEMGQTLGKALLEDFSGDKELHILVIEEYMERDSVNKRAQGLYDALGDSVMVKKMKRSSQSADLSHFIETLIQNSGEEIDAVVALSKETLQILCGLDADIMENIRLYGIGNTASIVAAMDKGRVERLVFQNEFNIGYMGVKTLMAEMGGIRGTVSDIDFYCVEKKDIYETQYERLLFPIVE